MSLVVPVDNVAPYVGECLQSIAQQTHARIEAIVVDDGSTDGGGMLCDEVASRDHRVRVFHSENRGLSAARNFGLAHVRGDFVLFVDSDDWIEPNAVEALVSSAVSHDADIVVCRYTRERLDGTSVVYPKPDAYAMYTHDEGLHALVCDGYIPEPAWGKLFRRELLSSFEFAEGFVCEDVEGVWKVFDRARRVCCVTDVLFHYRERADSITSVVSTEMLAGRWRAFSGRYRGLSGRSRHLHDATLRQCAGTVVYAHTQLSLFSKGERESIAAEMEEMRLFVREHSLEVLLTPTIPLRSKLAFLLARWNGPMAVAAFSRSYRVRQWLEG